MKIDLLKGVRVLLVAHYVPGATAAYLLRCLGAEVVKVEPPFHDRLRTFPPHFSGVEGQMGAWFRTLNAGFRSIVCDFKSESDRRLFGKLARKCDLLIDGNRPGYLESVLGQHPEKVHDRLIYLPISAHGQVGPLRDVAGHDNNVMALAGNLSYTTPTAEGLPGTFSAPIADINSGYLAAFLGVTALFARQSGQSDCGVRTFDPSMLHAAFFLNQMQVATLNLVPEPPQASRAWMNGGLANYTSYRTADDQAVFLGPIEPKLFANFAAAIDRPDLNDLLYAQNEALRTELQAIFAGRTAAEWEAQLAGIDACFTVVRDLQAALVHPQIQALGLVREIDDPHYGKMKLSGFPAGFGPESQPPDVPDHAPEPGADAAWVEENWLDGEFPIS
ncbi:MAG: CoA transferase [Bacteroidota bacterium]